MPLCTARRLHEDMQPAPATTEGIYLVQGGRHEQQQAQSAQQQHNMNVCATAQMGCHEQQPQQEVWGNEVQGHYSSQQEQQQQQQAGVPQIPDLVDLLQKWTQNHHQHQQQDHHHQQQQHQQLGQQGRYKQAASPCARSSPVTSLSIPAEGGVLGQAVHLSDSLAAVDLCMFVGAESAAVSAAEKGGTDTAIKCTQPPSGPGRKTAAAAVAAAVSQASSATASQQEADPGEAAAAGAATQAQHPDPALMAGSSGEGAGTAACCSSSWGANTRPRPVNLTEEASFAITAGCEGNEGGRACPNVLSSSNSADSYCSGSVNSSWDGALLCAPSSSSIAHLCSGGVDASAQGPTNVTHGTANAAVIAYSTYSTTESVYAVHSNNSIRMQGSRDPRQHDQHDQEEVQEQNLAGVATAAAAAAAGLQATVKCQGVTNTGAAAVATRSAAAASSPAHRAWARLLHYAKEPFRSAAKGKQGKRTVRIRVKKAKAITAAENKGDVKLPAAVATRVVGLANGMETSTLDVRQAVGAGDVSSPAKQQGTFRQEQQQQQQQQKRPQKQQQEQREHQGGKPPQLYSCRKQEMRLPQQQQQKQESKQQEMYEEQKEQQQQREQLERQQQQCQRGRNDGLWHRFRNLGHKSTPATSIHQPAEEIPQDSNRARAADMKTAGTAGSLEGEPPVGSGGQGLGMESNSRGNRGVCGSSSTSSSTHQGQDDGALHVSSRSSSSSSTSDGRMGLGKGTQCSGEEEVSCSGRINTPCCTESICEEINSNVGSELEHFHPYGLETDDDLVLMEELEEMEQTQSQQQQQQQPCAAQGGTATLVGEGAADSKQDQHTQPQQREQEQGGQRRSDQQQEDEEKLKQKQGLQLQQQQQQKVPYHQKKQQQEQQSEMLEVDAAESVHAPAVTYKAAAGSLVEQRGAAAARTLATAGLRMAKSTAGAATAAVARDDAGVLQQARHGKVQSCSSSSAVSGSAGHSALELLQLLESRLGTLHQVLGVEQQEPQQQRQGEQRQEQQRHRQPQQQDERIKQQQLENQEQQDVEFSEERRPEALGRRAMMGVEKGCGYSIGVGAAAVPSMVDYGRSAMPTVRRSRNAQKACSSSSSNNADNTNGGSSREAEGSAGGAGTNSGSSTSSILPQESRSRRITLAEGAQNSISSATGRGAAPNVLESNHSSGSSKLPSSSADDSKGVEQSHFPAAAAACSRDGAVMPGPRGSQRKVLPSAAPVARQVTPRLYPSIIHRVRGMGDIEALPLGLTETQSLAGSSRPRAAKQAAIGVEGLRRHHQLSRGSMEQGVSGGLKPGKGDFVTGNCLGGGGDTTGQFVAERVMDVRAASSTRAGTAIVFTQKGGPAAAAVAVERDPGVVPLPAERAAVPIAAVTMDPREQPAAGLETAALQAMGIEEEQGNSGTGGRLEAAAAKAGAAADHQHKGGALTAAEVAVEANPYWSAPMGASAAAAASCRSSNSGTSPLLLRPDSTDKPDSARMAAAAGRQLLPPCLDVEAAGPQPAACGAGDDADVCHDAGCPSDEKDQDVVEAGAAAAARALGSPAKVVATAAAARLPEAEVMSAYSSRNLHTAQAPMMLDLSWGGMYVGVVSAGLRNAITGACSSEGPGL